MLKGQQEHIHFIGIGGIGVSALARYYLAQGAAVSGSDINMPDITDPLKKEGALIFEGYRAENVPDEADRVVYTAATEEDNPELRAAKSKNIKCQTYAQALGDLTKQYFTIAISGTHGKSTTTAMLALILVEAGLDPTVIVGTKLAEFGDSNFRAGKSKYLVIEADEYKAAFLNYWPKIIVLTNIEADHLDFYRDIGQIKKTFSEYVGHLGEDGILVKNDEDQNINEIAASPKVKTKKYGLKEKIDNLNLKVPGRHNLLNAAAAIITARELGIADEISVWALNKFNGTWRRFEYKGELNGAKIFDDYGHHPTEIKATLQGAREMLINSHKPYAKLWCVFRPHQYQRIFYLFDEFAAAFDEADKVVLLPIYSVPGREKEEIVKAVSSEKLAQKIKEKGKDVESLGSFQEAARYIKQNAKAGDLILVMGAGDVWKLTEMLFTAAKA
ncbi:MAG: UDP-N-acetylmuramate--L-alanine ligase [Candidatus Portnoybacteria bacterium]|nr:UDP-N-acetylmuramate--L-alanine ligase [Candidatus Portnoybacteria bacterium]